MSDQGRPGRGGRAEGALSGVLIGVGALVLVVGVGALARHHPLWSLAAVAPALLGSFAIVRERAVDKRRALAVAVGLAGALATSPLGWWLYGLELVLWTIAVVAGVWLLTSLLVGKMLPKKPGVGSKEGFLSWLSNHKAVAGSVAVAYLSATGLVYETVFYAELSLSALRYVDPASVVYAIFSAWELAAAALASAFVLLFVPWLLHRLGTLPKWGGSAVELVADREWVALPVWILALPAMCFVVVRALLIVVATVVFILLPLGVAGHVAERAYDGIGDERQGTLQLSRPAVSAAGVRHVASTSAHMILVHRCGVAADSNGNGSRREPRDAVLIGAAKRMGGIFQRGVVRQPSMNADGKDDTDMWLPIVVPWTVVASFDLGDRGEPNGNGHDAEDPEGAGRVAGPATGQAAAGTEGGGQDGCSVPWSPTLSAAGSPGPEGPKGDSVSAQYSRDGAAEGEWLDSPTPDVRYIRFKAGGGEWEPPGGIRIAGSSELWYGVPFRRFSLVEDVASQLAVASVVPQLPAASTGGGCRVEVTGCASDTPFFHWCRERTGSTACTGCERDDAACRPMLVRSDEDTGVSTYHAAGELLRHLLVADGEAACRGFDCVQHVNRVLNCGAANLRSLAAAAALPSTPGLDAMLGGVGLRMPTGAGDPATYVPRVGELLVAACWKVADGPASAGVVLRAARAVPGGSQCVAPPEARLNHAAIIRLDGKRADAFGGCLQTVGPRV